MKKPYIFFLSMVFCFSTAAQQSIADESIADQFKLLPLNIDMQAQFTESDFGIFIPFVNSSLAPAEKTNMQKLDSLYNFQFDGSTWNLDSRYYFTYNAAGKMDLWLDWQWDAYTLTWQCTDKQEIAYDAANNMSLLTNYSWNSQSNQWQAIMKEEFAYDVSNNPSSVVFYLWDNVNSLWGEWFKYEYIYTNQLMQTLIAYTYGNGAWLYSSKYEYSYNANNTTDYYIQYIWNANASQWDQNIKYVYTYDANGNNTLIEQLNWDGTAWYNHMKTEKTFNANNKITYEISFNWDGTSWINMNKCDYTWDAEQNLEERLPATWSSDNQAWSYQYKYNHSYDNNYTFNDLILPYSYSSFDNNHMRIEQLVDYYDATNWVDNERIEYYYSEGTIDISDLESKALENAIYPNPATCYVNVRNEKIDYLKIFDLQGRLLLEIEISRSKQVCIENLNEGFYVYRLYNNKNIVAQGKLMVK